ncbi:BQ2448_2695 [Microbotryum intermedium]|uniref:BQ2448_2695 protein n=1 Tax=Microbotryum intermedium TaxID=269621 RepID=A0A238FD53_9BASI|nr:BQ2448_2695 [Microbotryum intermedium]
MRATTPTNKPLRAKVDLSQFASPSVSNASVNTPSPRIRTHNIREGGVGVGAPSSATATTKTAKRAAVTHANSSSSPQLSPLIRAQSSTSSLSTRANSTWSPNFAASTSTRSSSPTRPPHSPPQRYGTPTMATVAKDLKGQNDPFPKTIDYLPLSVSVRKVHSPPLRSSPSHFSQSSGHGPLASSSSSYFPPGLSTSPGSTSTTSSPLTSPSISSPSFDSHVNINAANPVNAGPRRVKSAISSGVQCGPGADPPTPVSVLLPAFSVGASTTTPAPLSRTTAGMRTRSPQRESVHATMASRTSSTRPVLSPRPASTTSTASPRHARSHSATSTTSSIFSLTGSDTIASPSLYTSRPIAVETNPLHVVASTSSWGRKDSTTSTGTRSSGMSDQGLMCIDWSRPQHFEEEDEDDESDRDFSFDGGGHESQDGTSDSNRRRRALADQTVMMPSPSLAGEYPSQRPGLVNQISVDELSEEKEARIQRKILDLEITNKSLLSINASLEQLKIKHTAELRDMRRRMRESNAGLALAPFRTPQSPRKTKAVSTNGSVSPFEGISSDDEEDGDDEGGDESEVSWERILDKDPHYAAVCQTIEALMRRGKQAIASKVEEKNLGGRVLNAMEIQQEGDSSDDLVRWVDAEVQTDGHVRTMSSTSAGASSTSAGRKMVNGWQR